MEKKKKVKVLDHSGVECRISRKVYVLSCTREEAQNKIAEDLLGKDLVLISDPDVPNSKPGYHYRRDWVTVCPKDMTDKGEASFHGLPKNFIAPRKSRK